MLESPTEIKLSCNSILLQVILTETPVDNVVEPKIFLIHNKIVVASLYSRRG